MPLKRNCSDDRIGREAYMGRAKVTMENHTTDFSYSLGLRLSKGEVFFGPGLAMLLRALEKTGSLKKAADSIDMSYSKGWYAVKRAEEALGFTLIEKRCGGSGGGGSCLTEKGRDFLEKYQEFERKAYEFADTLFLELYGEDI